MKGPERKDLIQIARGFLMGGADIIPGVSGGTVALVLGIYERLVTAISHVDSTLLGMLFRRKWADAAEYLDLRFLVTLGIGILVGVGSLSGLMRYLLWEQRSYTLAVFFGLILGSSVIVTKTVALHRAGQWLVCFCLALAAAVFAYWLVGLQQVGFHDSPGYFFLCGSIAICAMILPGISGAYILWLLGAYIAVTEIIHNVLKFQVTLVELISIVVFSAGCAVGLVSFSKILRWLLAHWHNLTMTILGGFMIGSLRLMWPFQQDLTPDVEKLKLKRFEPVWPASWDQEVTVCLLLAVGALSAVLLLERWGSTKTKNSP